MHKILITVAGLLMASHLLFAQSSRSTTGFKLTLSEEMKEPSYSTIGDYLGEDEDYIYVLRGKAGNVGLGMVTGGMAIKSVLIIESYNRKLTLQTQRELEPEVNGDRADFSNVAFLDGQLYAYFTLVDKKAEETNLYYQPIDNKTLMLSGTPKKIASISYDKKRLQGYFDYDISKDKKAIAIIAVHHAEKEMNEQFTATVCDARMNKLWQKDITLPYESKLFVNEGMLLDDNGNIYIRGRIYTETVKEKKKGAPNYSYKILAYRDEGNSFKEYDVNLKDKFITDLGFNITDDDQLAVAGFYSDRGTTTIKGVCFMLIDAATEDVVKQGTKEFDASFMGMFNKKDVSKKNTDPELWEYDLDNIVIRSDGGALLLAEQFYIHVSTTTTRTGNSVSTRTVYYYHYNDIIAVNINPNMTIAWATRIPKRQTTANDGGYFSSYAYAIKDDKIYLLFNDNPDNLHISNPSSVAKYTSPKKSAATLVTIGSDGKWKKSLVFSNKEEGVILRPKICEQSGPDHMFLYAEKGKHYVIGRVDL